MRGKAAGLAFGVTLLLTALKFGAAFVTGSVGVLSEAIHSLLDLISASVSVFTVREAVKPADDDHPFGHGKIETISSLFEALLLVGAAALMIYEGFDHALNPQPLAHSEIAIAVIAFAGIVSAYMWRHNLHAGRETESTALHVNALHFLSDVVASVGVLAALIIMRLTGWNWIDPAIAFAVAIYILIISASQIYKTLGELADRGLPAEELKRVDVVWDKYRPRMINAHALRTRKAGVTRHIDFHLVLCGNLSVHDSHDLCDEMEQDIERAIPGASVNIHVEPCESEKPGCRKHCLFEARA